MNIITQKLFAKSNACLSPVTDARIATCPHIVNQPGHEHLGDKAFEEALQERGAWLADIPPALKSLEAPPPVFLKPVLTDRLLRRLADEMNRIQSG